MRTVRALCVALGDVLVALVDVLAELPQAAKLAAANIPESVRVTARERRILLHRRVVFKPLVGPRARQFDDFSLMLGFGIVAVSVLVRSSHPSSSILPFYRPERICFRCTMDRHVRQKKCMTSVPDGSSAKGSRGIRLPSPR